MNSTPPARSRRRWVLASIITVIALAVLSVGAMYLLLRPPISERRVQEIMEAIEARSTRDSAAEGEDVSEEATLIFGEMRKLLTAWDVENDVAWSDLTSGGTIAADDAVWLRLETTFAPVVDRLKTFPAEGHLPSRDPIRDLDHFTRTAPVIPLHELQNLSNIVRSLARGAELREQPGRIVPLVNGALPFVVVRDEETMIGLLIAKQLVMDLTPHLAPGIPHASADDLRRLQRRLRHATTTLDDFDRVVAGEALATIHVLKSAAADPSMVETLGVSGPIHGSTTYLEYQVALTAKRWAEYFALPRDAGWTDLVPATREFSRRMQESAGGWRSILSDMVWANFSHFAHQLAGQHLELIAYRVAVAAELHRREHGAYPNDLAPLAPLIDPTHGWISGPEAITIESTAKRCRITVSAPNTPATGVVLEAPE